MSTIEEPRPAATAIPHDYSKRLMVFGGRCSMELAAKIAGKLDLDLGQVDLKTFANGEVYCRYDESIRGADVFLVQSTAANEASGMTPNDALMELLMMIDAAQGASAHRIIAVMPWYGYARQDKKSAPREPISARIVAKCLEGVGVDRVLTMDLHAGQVQGFFHIPVDHMTAMPMLTQWFIDQNLTDELVIVSPDAGRVKMARNFARKVGTHWAVMEKERPAQQVAEIGYVVGDVKGKTAVLVDDMIDTAGTLCAAAQTVLEEGAARVIACATHGVFSGPAYERLAESAGSSGSSSPTRSRCGPARPTTSRCSRPPAPSPTRSGASSPTTRSQRSSPAKTSCSRPARFYSDSGAGHRLLLALAGREALLRLEHAANVLAKLGGVLVLVYRDRVLRGGLHNLILFADDRQRAIRLALETPAIGHLARHKVSFVRGARNLPLFYAPGDQASSTNNFAAASPPDTPVPRHSASRPIRTLEPDLGDLPVAAFLDQQDRLGVARSSVLAHRRVDRGPVALDPDLLDANRRRRVRCSVLLQELLTGGVRLAELRQLGGSEEAADVGEVRLVARGDQLVDGVVDLVLVALAAEGAAAGERKRRQQGRRYPPSIAA